MTSLLFRLYSLNACILTSFSFFIPFPFSPSSLLSLSSFPRSPPSPSTSLYLLSLFLSPPFACSAPPPYVFSLSLTPHPLFYVLFAFCASHRPRPRFGLPSSLRSRLHAVSASSPAGDATTTTRCKSVQHRWTGMLLSMSSACAAI